MIKLDPNREKQLEEMNRSKRGRPFVYADLSMGSIAYLRYMVGRSLRITGGMAGAMLGEGAECPDHSTIRRRACARGPSPYRR